MMALLFLLERGHCFFYVGFPYLVPLPVASTNAQTHTHTHTHTHTQTHTQKKHAGSNRRGEVVRK